MGLDWTSDQPSHLDGLYFSTRWTAHRCDWSDSSDALIAMDDSGMSRWRIRCTTSSMFYQHLSSLVNCLLRHPPRVMKQIYRLQAIRQDRKRSAALSRSINSKHLINLYKDGHNHHNCAEPIIISPIDRSEAPTFPSRTTR